MRAKFLLAAICIFSLPLCSSTALGIKTTNPAPYASVVYAGHNLPDGSYCECNNPNCPYAPQQQSVGQNAAPVLQPGQETQTKADNTWAGDAGAGLIALTMLLLWLQLKN